MAPSPSPRPQSAAAIALVGVVAAVAALGFRWVGADAWSAVRSGRLLSPVDLLLLGVAGLGLALTGWLVLGAGLCIAARAPGAVGRGAHALAARVTPEILRRAFGVALGGSVALGVGNGLAYADASVPTAPTTAPTAAAPAPGPSGSANAPDPGFAPVGRTTITISSGGWSTTVPPTGPAPIASTPTASTPTASATTPAPPPGGVVTVARPTPTSPTGAGPTHTSPTPTSPTHPGSLRTGNGDRSAAGTVVVARGDSLWRLAARQLGPHASERQIAAQWPRWYAANRATIGPDPGRLRVGQVLVVPASGS